ncbi:MAG TPA: hypothetical protein VGB46_00925 [Flavisolibacter sp.]|jgi:hypothetical protein
MANGGLTIITDPLGNKIKFLDNLCAIEQFMQEGEVYDDLSTVITRPAILIELSDTIPLELYYYRSIGWNHTLLIGVRKSGSEWEAFQCQRNPEFAVLSGLLKKGKQLI